MDRIEETSPGLRGGAPACEGKNGDITSELLVLSGQSKAIQPVCRCRSVNVDATLRPRQNSHERVAIAGGYTRAFSKAIGLIKLCSIVILNSNGVWGSPS